MKRGSLVSPSICHTCVGRLSEVKVEGGLTSEQCFGTVNDLMLAMVYSYPMAKRLWTSANWNKDCFILAFSMHHDRAELMCHFRYHSC